MSIFTGLHFWGSFGGLWPRTGARLFPWHCLKPPGPAARGGHEQREVMIQNPQRAGMVLPHLPCWD